MSHKKAKWQRRLEREQGILQTGEGRQFQDRYDENKNDAFSRAHPITEEMIQALVPDVPEEELRYMQENGYRFSAERKSFLSPALGWFDAEGNVHDF